MDTGKGKAQGTSVPGASCDQAGFVTQVGVLDPSCQFSLFALGTGTRAFGVRANCISNFLYPPLSPAQASSQHQAASSGVASHQKAFQTCQARLSQATQRWINFWHRAGLPYIHTHACPPGPEVCSCSASPADQGLSLLQTST